MVRIVGRCFELLGILFATALAARIAIWIIAPASTPGAAVHPLEIVLTTAVALALWKSGRMLRAGRRLGGYLVLGALVVVTLVELVVSARLVPMTLLLLVIGVVALKLSWRHLS